MKIAIAASVLVLGSLCVTSCGDEPETKPKVDVKEDTPEYKAYDVVQNLKVVRALEGEAKKKNQTISLKVNSTYTNGKDGFFWFQVVQNIGKAQLPKMNIKVAETSYEVTIRDDETGENITEEAYMKKYPVKP